jgi:hypothetical protein
MDKRSGIVIGVVALLAGCTGALRSGSGDPAAEHVGYLSQDGFVPCGASPGTDRWRPIFAGPAARQEEHLRNTGLLSLPRPLLVRVAGRVSTQQPGPLSMGFTHSISVTDILGMWLAGECGSPDSGFRPITQARGDGARGT